MIFPVLECEKIIQVSDKTRLDAGKSFISGGSQISKIEIDPENSGTFYELPVNDSGIWFLDWLFETPGATTVKLKITDTDLNEKEVAQDILVITESEDALFSNDNELEKYFTGVSDYLPRGKSSFKSIHREVQSLIINRLFKMGIKDEDGKRMPPSAFLDNEEVRQWSTYLALEIIMQNLSNEPDDKWDRDAGLYAAKASRVSQKVMINLDYDLDGILDENEGVSFSGISVRKTW